MTIRLRVDDYGFSSRALSALKYRFNITWLDELQGFSERELLEARNFGHTTLNEIKQALKKHNLTLKDNKVDLARELQNDLFKVQKQLDRISHKLREIKK